MYSLVQSGKYVAINTADTTKNGFYVIKFISEAYTLQNNTIIYRQIILAGELVVNANLRGRNLIILSLFFSTSIISGLALLVVADF